MSDWIEQYSAALSERDAREKANKPYIDAYTKLADRTASPPTHPPPAPDSSSSTPPAPEKFAAPPDQANQLLLLRTNLASTQKARSTLQTQLSQLQTQLSTLQTTQRASESHIALLTRQNETIERSLKDRDDELRGKSKMVQDAHDEMVALELQLNLAEEARGKAEALAGELTRRWNERMEGEARRMNEESGF